MHWFYIIKSTKHNQLYIGYTKNFVKRLEEHNSGKSQASKKYLPWKPVYLEGYANEEEAKNREFKIKQFGKVYSQLKRRIGRSLRS